MRVRALSRKMPSIALVTAKEFCFCTPRIDMHRWVPSQTTATPRGSIFSQDRLGDLLVMRSWICSRRANTSTSRGILLRPMTRGVRNVGDVAFAEERQQMVLAHAVEIDVLDDDHLAVVNGEQRVVEHLVDIRAVATRQKPQRLLDAQRRARQTLAVGVFAQLVQQLADEILHIRILHAGRGRLATDSRGGHAVQLQ